MIKTCEEYVVSEVVELKKEVAELKKLRKLEKAIRFLLQDVQVDENYLYISRFVYKNSNSDIFDLIAPFLPKGEE